MADSRSYLSVCAIYRDEASYLREWIEFHRMVGVERFFLYDNQSTDDHQDVLAPYLRAGIAVVREWPFMPAQIEAYNDCLETYRDESRWLAFIDIDEFLFSPTGDPVSGVLQDYEEHPAVAVNWAVYGSSGHRTRPPGLVIENYVRRTNDPRLNRGIKLVIDPSRTTRCLTPHSFLFAEGDVVGEDKLFPRDRVVREPVTWKRLRINHYLRKSEEEFRRKRERPNPATGIVAAPPSEASTPRARLLNEQHDGLLTSYAPAVKDALARVARDGEAALMRPRE